MANKDSFQKYLDAGIAFTNLTRARAEELVAELMQDGEFRGDARAKVDELLERSRKSREALFTQIRQEVDRQLDSVGITNLDDLAKQVAALLGRTAEAGRAATSGRRATAKKGTGKKSAAKKATKKSPAKKATAKKATAKKATAKKAAAKKSPAKRAAAKKSAAKKSPAKRAAAKKSGPGAAG